MTTEPSTSGCGRIARQPRPDCEAAAFGARKHKTIVRHAYLKRMARCSLSPAVPRDVCAMISIDRKKHNRSVLKRLLLIMVDQNQPETGRRRGPDRRIARASGCS